MQNKSLRKVYQNLKFTQMTNNSRSTEDEIVQAACTVFLLYGYHGTTLQQIASKANVNKSAIHYYYRSKEKLYKMIVKLIVDLVLIAELDFYKNSDTVENPTWFLFTELYNNRDLFEQTFMELYPDNWKQKAKDLNIWLEFSNMPLSYTLRGSDWTIRKPVL